MEDEGARCQLREKLRAKFARSPHRAADYASILRRTSGAGAAYDVVHPLTDEPWGVRRFFVVEPSGLVENTLGQTTLGDTERSGQRIALSSSPPLATSQSKS